MDDNKNNHVSNLTLLALYRLTTLPRATGCLGDIGNMIAFISLGVLSCSLWFVGLKAWGGVQGATMWAFIIMSALYVVWFVLSRISGWLNAIAMVMICWSGFTGSGGIIRYTENFSTVANYIRQPGSNGEQVLHDLGGIQAYTNKNNVEIVDDYLFVLEHGWIYYGSFKNPWYTLDRFKQAWDKFESAPSKNTELPFFTEEDIKGTIDGDTPYSILDHHH